MKTMRSALLLGVIACAGCATVPTEPAEWPSAIPTRAYYLTVYAGDENNQATQTLDLYLTWVVRFYHGFGPAEGWKKIEAKLVDGMTPQETMLTEPKIAYLGMLMSGEWAKDNKKRRVTTEMLLLWGSVMTRAKGESNVDAVLDRLIADVRGIICDEVKPKEIKTARYADLLPAKTAKGQ